jgi:LPXTG-motif cell wall-anchored protein
VATVEGALGDDGQYGSGGMISDHAYAMIALSSVNRTVPAAAIDFLLSKQIADGTWSWNGDTTEGSGDNNTSAFAIVALSAAGVPADHPQVAKTLAHFKGQQNADGGFPYIVPSPYGTDSDSNSTAVVMWAILSTGGDPAGVDWKFQGQDGLSALDKLRAFQNESGAFRWQDGVPGDNFLSTVQALIALELKTLPYARTDVGAAIAEEEREEKAEVGEPMTLPETGANAWLPALSLLAGGATLAGLGVVLRKRR